MQKLFVWARRWWPGLIPLAVMWMIAAQPWADLRANDLKAIALQLWVDPWGSVARLWTNPPWKSSGPLRPRPDPLPLEADLSARSIAALKDIVLEQTPPPIRVDGRDVSLLAKAFSEEGLRDAVAAIESVPGVRLVKSTAGLVDEAKPFVWTAERDVAQVKLSGSAPLPEVKDKLIEVARKNLGEVKVDGDGMNLRRGAPAHFESAARLLLGQIGKLKVGKITISDGSITLSGMARDLGGREEIAAALTNLPEGFSVAANEIKAPPYIFEAYKDPVAGTVRLEGNVPDKTVHDRIVTAGTFKFVGETVDDKKLKTSPGAPPSFGNAVVAALGALSRLSTGTLIVSDNEVKLSGDALFESAAVDMRAGLGKDFPKNWQYKPEISVKPAAGQVDATVCQQLFSDLLTKGKVRFEAGRADINPDSVGLLDRVIETALRCPSASIEVAGHTDSDGDDSFNQALSEKRAQAVVDYLVKAGLPANRLTAVGYGRTQPVAGDETQEGKAQNRRIEFLVK